MAPARLILKKVGVPIAGISGITYFGFRYRVYSHERDGTLASPWEVSTYRALPLRGLSRLWGGINECHLPEWSRSYLLGAYAKYFGCNLEEAEISDLTQYKNLASFFRRSLKDGVRPISTQSKLVSPCDGKILHFGKESRDSSAIVIEQVKNVNYSLSSFLGPLSLNGPSVDPLPAHAPKRHSHHKLYHCVIYLAPGDYHKFHSPTDWTITLRRHFQGYLLSVNPLVAKLIGNLFILNERSVYMGEWEHGFFSMTAVGATNVGSIKVGCDPELATNCVKTQWNPDTFCENKISQNSDVDNKLSKGQYFGEFNLGSTIVLIFEAPPDFKFNIKEGDRIKMGQLL